MDMAQTKKNVFMANPPIVGSIVGLTLLAIIIAVLFGFRDSNEVEKTEVEKTMALTTEVENLEESVETLKASKAKLNTDLVAMTATFKEEKKKNIDLTASIEEKIDEIHHLAASIKKIKAKLNLSEKEKIEIVNANIKLDNSKKVLSANLNALEKSNEQLNEINNELSNNLNFAQQKLGNLEVQLTKLSDKNQELEQQLLALAPAGFSASNFKLVIEGKKGKLTTKAKKTKKVHVSFELNGVPKNKRGGKILYLVVKDAVGYCVQSSTSRVVELALANKNILVEAVDIQSFNLEASQKIAMSFRPSEKLEPGEYDLMIYSDAGYLGASGFVLQ